MKPRKTVFISSTAEDLMAYREAARDVVLDLGMYPEMMEHWGTDGIRSIADACAQRVEKSDVVIALIGWRRGSVVPVEKGGDGRSSYTKYELDAAFRLGKPVHVLLADRRWPGELWEDDPEARAWVKDFRGGIDRLAVNFAWEAAEIGSKAPLPLFRMKVKEVLIQPPPVALDVVLGGESVLALATWTQPPLPPRPYPVLGHYTDPRLFAGRDREIAEIRRRLRGRVPILGLYATSGAGKSSLLDAGLVAPLHSEGKPSALERRPDESGVASRLASSLLAASQGAPVLVDDDDHVCFVRLLRRVRHLAGTPPVLVLDQFEDLFRRPAREQARGRIGVLLAATVQQQPGIDGPLCHWIIAYRSEYHGEVKEWLGDVLRESSEQETAGVGRLPHDLAIPERFDDWALPLFAAPPPGAADAAADASARAFRAAIEKPLALAIEGRPAHPWRFAGDGAERLARVFAADRLKRPGAPLVPELQVVLAHLLAAAGEPERGEIATIEVDANPAPLVAHALEAHLEHALERVFPARRDCPVREKRSRVLLALRELADIKGRRSQGLPAVDLARAIGLEGEGVLDKLSAPDIRLVVADLRPDGLRYTLSHDRMAEVIVQVVDHERSHDRRLDIDRQVLELRRVVELNVELFAAGERDQSVRLSEANFRALEANAESLLWDDERRAWWAACRAEAAIAGRLKGLFEPDDEASCRLFYLLAGSGGWERRLREAIEKLGRDRLLRFFDLAWTDVGRERVRQLLEAVHIVRQAFASAGAFDLEVVGAVVWALDYFLATASKSELQGHAKEAREDVLATLRMRHAVPATLRPRAEVWKPIPAGVFTMGSPKGEGDDAERPQHEVEVSTFRLLERMVTNRDYRYLVPDHKGGDDLPAVSVSWYQAYAYAAWVGGRLPSEAEWEYAARADSKHDSSDRTGPIDNVAWYKANSGGQLHPVMQLKSNPWGLYDMCGNAWEWTADWAAPYGFDKQVNPWGPPCGGERVLRGASYWADADWARVAFRFRRPPVDRNVNQGFRVLL